MRAPPPPGNSSYVCLSYFVAPFFYAQFWAVIAPWFYYKPFFMDAQGGDKKDGIMPSYNYPLLLFKLRIDLIVGEELSTKSH